MEIPVTYRGDVMESHITLRELAEYLATRLVGAGQPRGWAALASHLEVAMVRLARDGKIVEVGNERAG